MQPCVKGKDQASLKPQLLVKELGDRGEMGLALSVTRKENDVRRRLVGQQQYLASNTGVLPKPV